jgi:hypothetical protein
MSSIRNYTSSVPAAQSVANIINRLVVAGATQIMQEYGQDKRLNGLKFIIVVEGKTVPIELPAKVAEVEKVLRAQMRRVTSKGEANAKAQAERTAWKLLLDWVDVQCTMIQLKQVDFLEVFLPYVWRASSGRTFYNEIKSGKFLALTSP